MKRGMFVVLLTILFFATPLIAQGPPVSSGPNVVRSEVYGWGWNFSDQKRGYFTVIGFDAVSFCSGVFVGSFWNLQETFPPADEDLVHVVLHGDDVLASVWPAWILEGDACDYILANPPIADGTVDVVFTDNDSLAGLNDHQRHNSWGMSAHGALTAPDGERMIFNGGFHCVWDPDFTKGHCKRKIVLN